MPILLLVVAVLAGVGATPLFRSALETRSWPQAVGTVIEIETRGSGKNAITYSVVEFTAVDRSGEEHIVTAERSRKSGEDIGDEVEVYFYAPDNVERFVTNRTRYHGVMVVGLLSAAALVGAFVTGHQRMNRLSGQPKAAQDRDASVTDSEDT